MVDIFKSFLLAWSWPEYMYIETDWTTAKNMHGRRACVTIVNFFRRGVISTKILIYSPAPSCFSMVTEVATSVLPVGERRGRVVRVILK